jgi:hypothetical protein
LSMNTPIQHQSIWRDTIEYLLGTTVFVKVIEWLTHYAQMYNAKFFTLLVLTILRSWVGASRAKKEGRFSKKILWQDTYDSFWQLIWIFSGIHLLTYIEPSASSAENYLYAMYGWLLFKSIAEDATTHKFQRKIAEFLKLNFPKGGK